MCLLISPRFDEGKTCQTCRSPGSFRSTTASSFNASRKLLSAGRDHHSRFREGKTPTRQVLAAGLGKSNEDGQRVPLDVKAGDTILFGNYSGQEIKLDGVEYLIMKEDEVLAIEDAGIATSRRTTHKRRRA